MKTASPTGVAVDRTSDAVTVDETAATWLGRWMVGVAVLSLLLFANLASLVLVPSRLTQLSPAFDAPVTSVAGQATIDALLMFGLDIVRGVADDIYLALYRDYVVDEFYYGFIVLHLIVIVTGFLAYRRATAPASVN